MKIRITFARDAASHEEKLTLLLMRFFEPTKLFWLGSHDSWGSQPEAIMEGAIPINPFEAMEQINATMVKEVKDWSHSFVVTCIEMESAQEKEKIATWILVDKLKPGKLI